jgi:hypothetical protein
MSATFDLAQDLIRRPSVTPVDAGCQELLAQRLAPGGYLHAATDWEEYAHEILATFAAEPLLANTAEAFAPRPAWRQPLWPVVRHRHAFLPGPDACRGVPAASRCGRTRARVLVQLVCQSGDSVGEVLCSEIDAVCRAMHPAACVKRRRQQRCDIECDGGLRGGGEFGLCPRKIAELECSKTAGECCESAT